MKLHLVALRTTRYSDSQSILTAFSREHGRVSLSVPAGKGREASRVRALTMPLGVVECESDVRPGREILPMRQVRPLCTFREVHSDPVKQMVAMFVAEVLALALRSGGEDEGLFEFVVEAVGALDRADTSQTANFPVCFLYRLAEKMGVEPDTATYAPGKLLDMREGVWRMSAPLHGESLGTEMSEGAYALSRMTFANMGAFRLSRSQRAAATDALLRYYGIHIAPMSPLRTLDILRAML